MAVVIHLEPVCAGGNSGRRDGNMRISEHSHRLLQPVHGDGWSNSVPKTASKNIHFDRGRISRVIGEHHFIDGRRLFVIFGQQQRRNGKYCDQQGKADQRTPLSRTLVTVHRGVLNFGIPGSSFLAGGGAFHNFREGQIK
jgi:hypothetical protein